MVVLGELLDRPELDLAVHSDPPGARRQSVRIVHASEVPGIEAWLRGGEILLTVGALLDLTDPEACADYAQRVRRSGAAALGVGLGSELPHRDVPAPLIAAARKAGLALFGVPEHVAFVDIVDAFTSLREAAYAQELHAVASAQRAVAGLLAGPGIERAVEALRSRLGAEVAVINPAGIVIAGGLGAPALAEAAAVAVRAAFADGSGPQPSVGGLLLFPVGAPAQAWLVVQLGRPSARSFSPRARDLILTTAAALLQISLSGSQPPDASAALSPAASLPERQAAWARTDSGESDHLRLLRIGEVPSDRLLRLVSWIPGTAGTAGDDVAAAVLCSPRAYPQVLQAARWARAEILEDVEADLESAAQTAAGWFGGGDPQAELANLLGALDADIAARFAGRLLGPLAAAPAAWTATLRTAARLGQTGEATAAELGLHRHTVRTHLKKLGELLGRDLQDPEQLRLMHVAFQLRERSLTNRM